MYSVALRVWSRTVQQALVVLLSEAALLLEGNTALIWLHAHCWPALVRITHSHTDVFSFHHTQP